MKQIMRRVYTKPIMLGMTLLVGAVVIVGLFVTTKSKAALPIIPKGDDLFETTGNGETYHNFGNAPIPAGFFTSNTGSPSQAYTQNMPLVGKPLTTGSDIDTIISRNEDVNVPGTTSLTMTGLSLDSISPITIHYANGTTEQWSVHVSLSAFKSSTGSMTIGSGGTFDSTLKVWPKFKFKSLLDGEEKELDTGSGSSLMASAATFSESGGVLVGDEPAPAPAPTIAPCAVASTDTASQSATAIGFSDAAASSSCPPVTLTSSNTPWQICNGKFCIPRPLTEAELWASHNASPPGTKKKIAAQVSNTSVQ